MPCSSGALLGSRLTTAHAGVRLVPVRAAEHVASCEELWSEYGHWATAESLRLTGRQVQPDHQGFRDELPDLMSGRGRLYLAELNGVPVGTGGLKITTPDFAEIKRMFVLPAARGLGISRVLVSRLIEDAASCGYERVRLDTMAFMATAQALYRSLGFVAVDPYDQSESVRAGITNDAVYLELMISPGAAPGAEQEMT